MIREDFSEKQRRGQRRRSQSRPSKDTGPSEDTESYGKGLALLIAPFTLALSFYVVMALLEGFVVVLEWMNSSTLGGVAVGMMVCLGIGVLGALVEE